MAEALKENTQDQPEEQTNSYLAAEAVEPIEQKNLLEVLFANGNTLITARDSKLNVTDETRRLLALFSDGTYFVSEDHKFDGLVYNFEKTIKRRKMLIHPPQYVSQNELNAI